MNFQTYLSQSTKEIGKTISHVFQQSRDAAPTPYLKKLYKIFENNTKGGKNLRGMLVLLGYELFEGNDKYILPVAAAYEILHTSLLIHDDIIDNSLLRRAKKSVPVQIGPQQALCLGDIGFFLCQKIIADSNFSPERKIQVTSLLSEMLINTISGESLDIFLAQNLLKKGKRNEKDILLIHSLKTAQYSVSLPLMLGALLAGADKQVIKNLQQFGEYVGIAFQIQDDILGVFGSEKELGKSITSDSEENKNTLLISYALSHANSLQKKIIQALYGKKHLTRNQLKKLQTIFHKTGSLSYSQEKAQEYIKHAKKILPDITENIMYQTMLSDFADFIIKRRK